mgnify:CR=1 FL=1
MPDRSDSCTTCRLVTQYDEPFVEVEYGTCLRGQNVDSTSLGYWKEHAPNEIKGGIND